MGVLQQPQWQLQVSIRWDQGNLQSGVDSATYLARSNDGETMVPSTNLAPVSAHPYADVGLIHILERTRNDVRRLLGSCFTLKSLVHVSARSLLTSWGRRSRVVPASWIFLQREPTSMASQTRPRQALVVLMQFLHLSKLFEASIDDFRSMTRLFTTPCAGLSRATRMTTIRTISATTTISIDKTSSTSINSITSSHTSSSVNTIDHNLIWLAATLNPPPCWLAEFLRCLRMCLR